MAITEDLNRKAASLAATARDLVQAPVVRVTLDVQASGEVPYRIETPEQSLAIPGLATISAAEDDAGEDTGPVAPSPDGG